MAIGNMGDDIRNIIESSATKKSKSPKAKTFEDELRFKKEQEFQKRVDKMERDIAEKRHKDILDLTYKDKEEAEQKARKRERLFHAESLKEWARYYDEQAQLADKASTRTVNYLKKATANAVSTLAKTTLTDINEYLGAYSQYMSGIETRLQNSGKSFSSVTATLNQNLVGSPYVAQLDVLKNLSALVDKGIAYNVEQRAFLETVSDRIATTFDSFDASLMRIIRIQQADSTVARLGMEAELTSFFNSTFGDTSYLSNLYDSTAAALLAASSTFGSGASGRASSVEFEYVVQKWLGSLSAVGVSDSTIQQLAQGIGYLGSGNITALSSNSQLQNLLVMAANKSGYDYGELLTGGLSASKANALLSSIVSFGQEIAQSGNQVVKSQYAQLFGLDISDMTALLNLTSSDLKEISSNLLSYQEAYNETEYQLGQIGSRMSPKDLMDNIFKNALGGIGESIANSPGGYLTYLLADLVQNATGGIEIALPMSGTLDLTKTIKAGVVGYGVIAQLGNLMNSLSNQGGLNLAGWGVSDITSRGTGLSMRSGSGLISTTSETAYIGSNLSGDFYEQSLVAQKEATPESIQSSEEIDEMTSILRDDIAVTLRSIYDLLYSQGVKVAGY